MTEKQCIKWVQENLPFLIRSKRGKIQYPFKSAFAARTIEESLGKALYKLLNNVQDGKVTLTEENVEIFNDKC